MQSAAASVEDYLAELPDDRRDAISAVREVILANLPAGLVETMNWGMIVYEIPLSVVPDTYNGQPLAFAGLASQKNYMSVYLMAIYGSDELRISFEEDYRATGKRLDMGKSCVRFRTLDDLPLDVIGRAVKACSMEQYIEAYNHTMSLRKNKSTRAAKK
ncbi:MAG: DUF1801 domain-containing protein [Actinobacteria bacterium]|jgi:hypothetical protein|nr:DUF1801 domain-containing protein [Actinomycetota bacterium]